MDISGLACSAIGSSDVSKLAAQLAARGIGPATVGNYLSHLAATSPWPSRFGSTRSTVGDQRCAGALRRLWTVAKSRPAIAGRRSTNSTGC